MTLVDRRPISSLSIGAYTSLELVLSTISTKSTVLPGSAAGELRSALQSTHHVTNGFGPRKRSMRLTATLKVSIAAACIAALAGCADLKPIEAQVEDLKAQVGKLQGETAKALSDAAAAKTQAAAANSAAAAAQSSAIQALSAAQANSAGIEAINNKIDQMFHRTLSK
jgi:hypothetical protein